MPRMNHQRPSHARACSGGSCCRQCGFVCHRHVIAQNAGIPIPVMTPRIGTFSWTDTSFYSTNGPGRLAVNPIRAARAPERRNTNTDIVFRSTPQETAPNTEDEPF